ncbi:hypothetical protein [Nocardioides sp.]|uniref:hypothetical protein n=1 Tax=Nocardioides sp. TaxID=35761 RepID=UPI0026088E51|nr:hypothetical protein [Nocardioides sp.]MCW2735455.1 hypothetical protein [Nocardioides sp.]
MRRDLHPVVAGHQHWGAFEREADKLAKAEAKEATRRGAAEAERREHERRLDEYHREVEAAVVEGREPEAKYPGPVPEEAPRRASAAQLFIAKRDELNAMTRSWAARKADELEDAVAAREAQLNAEAELALAALESAVAEMAQLRDTLGWVRVCAGRAQPVGLTPTLPNFLTARAEGFSLVSGIQERGATSLPMNLDHVDVS